MAGISARTAGIASGAGGLIALAWACAMPLFASPGQRVPLKPGISTTLCTAGETPLFSCGIGGKQVAVCGRGSQAVYRFGRPRQVEFATGDLTMAMRGFAGGGETQITARNKGYSYTVFDRTVRTAFDDDGRHDAAITSGLLVRKDGRIISTRTCSGDAPISPQAGRIVRSGAFVPH